MLGMSQSVGFFGSVGMMGALAGVPGTGSMAIALAPGLAGYRLQTNVSGRGEAVVLMGLVVTTIIIVVLVGCSTVVIDAGILCGVGVSVGIVLIPLCRADIAKGGEECIAVGVAAFDLGVICFMIDWLLEAMVFAV